MKERGGGESAAEPPMEEPIRYHNASSFASDPLPVRVDDRRLKKLSPELFGWSGRKAKNRRLRDVIVEHMRFGDTRAAVVVSSDPLLVAAYTDELDCVAILRFAPQPLSSGLAVGSRLLTVNTYRPGKNVAADLFPGPRHTGRYIGFYPIIADFICANQDVVDRRKANIEEEEWERTVRFGREYLTEHPGLSRDGSPSHSEYPAKIDALP